MKKTWGLVILFSLILSLPATLIPAAKKKLPPKDFPGIFIESAEAQEASALALKELKIEVQVIGSLAVTTMEMNFYNSADRVLEGNLSFPLAEGERVSRFAMEINGRLREGVVVEKAKARQVFESIVRSQIDPAVMEQTKGNHFNARIYPIPAKGYKKIIVGYESQLSNTKKGYTYFLPLGFPQRIGQFSLKMEVYTQGQKPHIKDKTYQDLDFKKSGASYVSQINLKNALLKEPVSFIIPEETVKETVFIESAAQETYFYLNLVPKKINLAKKKPKKIALVWDASLSAQNKKTMQEIKLLEKYFNWVKNAEVQLIVFRNEAEKPEKYEVKDGDWDKLQRKLKSLVYDGATQFGGLNFNAIAADEIIFSTDGIANFGGKEIRLGNTPVAVINSQTTAEHAYLKFVAQSTGGCYLNLSQIKESEALEQLTRQQFLFISAEYDSSAIKQVYPTIPTMVVNDFTMAGKLVKDQSALKLNFGVGQTIHYSQTVMLNKSKQKTDSQLVKRIWAMKKISELDLQYEKNEAEITKTAKAFSVVTRGTSLLILERLEDYVRYKVLPPKEMQPEYFALLGKNEENEKNKQQKHVEYVLGLLKNREEWYNKDFPMGDLPKKSVEEKKEILAQDHVPSERARESRMSDREDSAQRSESPRVGNAKKAKMKKGAKADKAGGQDEFEEDSKAKITLKKWTPEVPYLKELNQADEKDYYSLYLKLRREYQNSSAFYLDVADFFFEKKQRDLGLRILSNIAEMQLENPALLRILAHRLEQIKEYSLAVAVFRDVLKMREEEPQSYRDLGLALASAKQYQEAVEKLYHVAVNPWDSRFPEIQLIALEEMNAIIFTVEQDLNLEKLDSRLIKNMPLALRVTLSWDADNCDIDLWVIDANGEKSYFAYPLSYMGGLMSRDFTRGYGPEEYLLKKAKPGKYLIQANYYGNSQQIIAGATTIQLKLFTHFGSKKQKTEEVTLRLKDKREVIAVGEFEIE